LRIGPYPISTPSISSHRQRNVIPRLGAACSLSDLYLRISDTMFDTQTVLITNPEDRTKRARKLVKKSRDAVEHFATNHDDLTCMSTTHKASEADGKRVATKLGFAEVHVLHANAAWFRLSQTTVCERRCQETTHS
jgi:hypothetical protein